MKLEIKLIKELPKNTYKNKHGADVHIYNYLAEYREYNNIKQFAFQIYNKLTEVSKLKLNESYIVDYEINSREWSGKYYTNINVWKVEPITNAEQTQTVINSPDEPDDLPF